MLRRRIKTQGASTALFLLLLLIILLTFRRYGISWDEGVHDKIGVEIWNYYLSLLKGQVDRQVLSLGNPVAYGGVFNLITGGIQKLSPMDRFQTRHLVNALFGLLGILGCWKTTQLVAGDRAAFWSALLLAIIPGYYGHMFFNPKDIPFAAGYIWSLYYILGSIREFPEVSWPALIKLSLASGFAMGIRVGGVMLLGYFGLALLFEMALHWRRDGLHLPQRLVRRVVAPVLFVSVIAYAIMVAFWPWAQQNPLVNPFLALTAQGQIDYQDVVLYRGISYPGIDLPVDYVPGSLLVTMPEVILLILAAGLVLAGLQALAGVRRRFEGGRRALGRDAIGQVARSGFTRRGLKPPVEKMEARLTGLNAEGVLHGLEERGHDQGFSGEYFEGGEPAEASTPGADTEHSGPLTPSFCQKGILLLVFSIVFPVMLVIVQKSVLYDGVRHFIFILPPIACLAGISFQALSDRLGKGQKWAAIAQYLGTAVLIGLHVVTMARLHPYEYIYYNSLAGGLKGASQKYETDYWGLSTSEAAQWLEAYVENRQPAGGKVVPVYTCAGNASAAHFFQENLALVPSPERAHYGILITRWGCDQQVKGEVLYTVERYGVPLVYVKELY